MWAKGEPPVSGTGYRASSILAIPIVRPYSPIGRGCELKPRLCVGSIPTRDSGPFSVGYGLKSSKFRGLVRLQQKGYAGGRKAQWSLINSIQQITGIGPERYRAPADFAPIAQLVEAANSKFVYVSVRSRLGVWFASLQHS
jgi:hypothetical protein